MKKTKLIDFGIIVSFLLYLVSTIVKFTFAVISNSTALYADALNSVTDVIATFIMFIGAKISRKPHDENHQFGHQRFEQVTAMIAVMIMAVAGFEAFRHGVETLLFQQTSAPNTIGAFAAMFAAVIVGISAVINHYVYKKTKAMTSKVISKDNISDCIVSIGVAVAIITSQFGMWYIDAIASIIIAIVIFKTCFDLFAEAVHQLTDGFDEVLTSRYRQEALDVSGVKSVKLLRGRYHGVSEFIEITITVDAKLSIVEAHDIAELLEQTLNKHENVCETIVHFEPEF